MNATSEGVFPGQPEIFQIIHLLHIQWGIKAFDRFRRSGDEFILTFGEAGHALLQADLLPLLQCLTKFFKFLAIVHAVLLGENFPGQNYSTPGYDTQKYTFAIPGIDGGGRRMVE